MPAKRPFNELQYEKLKKTALKHKSRFKTQTEMALALGVTQQTLSNLFTGTYRPGVKVATHIAELDGRTLEDLVGKYLDVEEERAVKKEKGSRFPNLTACVAYHRRKPWSAWTVAAAEAGVFGEKDFEPDDWPGRLDRVEQALAALRAGPRLVPSPPPNTDAPAP